MMLYLLVGVGGIFGSLARYGLSKKISEKSNTTFPVATMVINVSGALFLGLINNIGLEPGWSLLLADGFTGAFTTFSTFMYEGFNLFQESEKLKAFLYILGSLLLGVIGFIAGFELGNLIKII